MYILLMNADSGFSRRYYTTTSMMLIHRHSLTSRGQRTKDSFASSVTESGTQLHYWMEKIKLSVDINLYLKFNRYVINTFLAKRKLWVALLDLQTWDFFF